MIPARDKEVIERYLYNKFALNPTNETIVHCIYSDDREIYRITIGKQSFIYKTVGTSKKSLDEFEIEFTILKKIWSSPSVKPNMPEPLLLLKGVGFLMTECSGEVMKDLYYHSLSPFYSNNKLYSAIEMSAQWLGDFHGIERTEEGYQKYYINRLDHLNRMIKTIKSFNVSASLSENLDKTIRVFSSTVSSNDVSICRLHGNFSLRNILAAENSVSLIDFEDSKVDTIYYDLGMFVAELLNKTIYVFNWFLNKKLIINFINEYSNSNLINNDILRAYVLYHLVWSYYEVVQRKKTKFSLKAIALKWKRYHLQTMITKLINSSIF